MNMIELANAPSSRPFAPTRPSRPVLSNRHPVMTDAAVQPTKPESAVSPLRVFKPVLAKPLTAFGFQS
jgi:hypothetical protein